MYSVFTRLDDGEFVCVATCDDVKQATQIVEAFNASWPRKYVVRDSAGNDVYPKEQPPMLSSIHILVVDDYQDWRKQVRLLLQARPEWQIICEVSDGSEAVQKAQESKPDVILLDIGIPKINGIEAARRMRRLSPNSKIVFLSMEHSPDVVEAALSTGAHAYVYKTRAQTDLLLAIDAVLRGEQFTSSNIKAYGCNSVPETKTVSRHEVQFYSDDAGFVDGFSRIVAAALEPGDVAIVVATKSHRDGLAARLKAQGLDIEDAIRQRTYISLDANQMLLNIMVDDMPDSDRLFEVVGPFIRAAAKAGKRRHPRVVACGECAPILLTEGKPEAAIRLEQLWNQLATTCEIDIFCGYALSSFHGEEDEHILQSVCAEHSAVGFH